MEKEKTPVPSISKIPKRYNRNTISGDLHRSRKIPPNFDTDIKAITTKKVKLDNQDDL